MPCDEVLSGNSTHACRYEHASGRRHMKSKVQLKSPDLSRKSLQTSPDLGRQKLLASFGRNKLSTKLMHKAVI